MEIKDLKIGDWVYKFHSSILNKYTPHNDYSFSQIIGETLKQWKLGGHNIRKSDLKIIGSVYSFERMHIMNKTAREMKRIQEEDAKTGEQIKRQR